jgi:hypothetical protein
LAIELQAWRTINETYGLARIAKQVSRLESILRRDCNKRYPDPDIL